MQQPLAAVVLDKVQLPSESEEYNQDASATEAVVLVSTLQPPESLLECFLVIKSRSFNSDKGGVE